MKSTDLRYGLDMPAKRRTGTKGISYHWTRAEKGVRAGLRKRKSRLATSIEEVYSERTSDETRTVCSE